ncbi:WD40 repeat [Macleaya cordata]|uniref:WD40 repeat n=1 Tax=Macleaya cordata TaxID=56857 RepID=A0A200QEB1_MACCD|nr:WD40 repeat [Macleaya cordata]
MKGTCLNIETRDAISRILFAPRSNNLLISSWDSTLRLYDVDRSVVRFEASLEVALLGCCFQDESTAFSIGSDCCIRRHDFGSGIDFTIGKHDDLATCVEYSEKTCQAITAGLDKRIMSWDMRMEKSVVYSELVGGEVESISLCGLYLIVAMGTSINIYDLRNFKEPLQTTESCMDYRVRCVNTFPNWKGYAVGSVDGRVALKCLNPSDANEMSCIFRCYPKSRDGRRHLVAVNDIVFNPSHYGAFVTGDNEGYATMWDAQSRKRLFQFPRYPSSVASISYNHGGQLLAVASSYTYQEANEIEKPPQIFIHEMDENDMDMGSAFQGSSKSDMA